MWGHFILSNETDSELDHILYLGNLVLLDHQNGKYRIYDPEEKSGNGYDFVEGDGAAGIGEMRYFSVKRRIWKRRKLYFIFKTRREYTD